MTTMRWVYRFGGGHTDGRGDMRDLLGGKGAGLAEMARLGLPVPPGFTITTVACRAYFEGGGSLPDGLEDEVRAGLAHIEAATGFRFGDAERPLLVSVRSGAPVSMPGMMDTILNVGLNPQTVEALAAQTGNPRFAWDSYRRLVYMYGDVVLKVEARVLSEAVDAALRALGVHSDQELDAEGMKYVACQLRDAVEAATGAPFPDDPLTQLWRAIVAVFESWNNERARAYRAHHGIDERVGTACNVQAMVFGNLGEDSATGVAFTRNPSTGEPGLYGEYLPNAQGEDVVAGTHTPRPLRAALRTPGDPPSLEEAMPEVFAQLVELANQLERHYRDMQDIEFTVQRGVLWLLQTRTGKREPRAAVRVAVDMAHEGLIGRDEAVLRIDPSIVVQVLHPRFDPAAVEEARGRGRLLARGLAASSGGQVGHAVFTPEDAVEWASHGRSVVLVRKETSPEDMKGIQAAVAIVTARGGMTSHAAVVARGLGKTCVVGASGLVVDEARRRATTRDGRVIREGDVISVDGSTGEVFEGRLPTVASRADAYFDTLMSWADAMRKLGVRANADTPQDARTARSFGAQGIGLCRTEHMFFGEDRIVAMRRMILAQTPEERRAALAAIIPMQRADFEGILRAMEGLPVTIRLLDPPLHEFLPREDAEIDAVAQALGVTPAVVRARAEALHESNPMLGHRGCRLAVTAPEIYEAQVRAVAEATAHLRSQGVDAQPEIMIPLVAFGAELERLRQLVEQVVARVAAETGQALDIPVGTMIELPRAALMAAEIATHADFFSFGTNDLTQTTLGISRDDAGHFLPAYLSSGLLHADPFAQIEEGVARLVAMATQAGRQARAGLKVGVCGEHGGDPASVRVFHDIGLDYVSCSPFRVPVARLAAAHAALEETRGNAAQ